MMRALGAEVVTVAQLHDSRPGQVSGGDLELVEQAARRIALERKAFRADQFHHSGNVRARYLHTGPEILRQAGAPIDAFCDFAGTAGSFAGCAAALKEHHPATRCFIVEPEGCAVLGGGHAVNSNHRIQGGGYSMPDLPLIRREHVDGYMRVGDDEAIAVARRLAREEAIFAGFSSGANIAAALRLVAGKTVVTLINDSGMKYLSTDLWP
jgi:cysteine synthase A